METFASILDTSGYPRCISDGLFKVLRCVVPYQNSFSTFDFTSYSTALFYVANLYTDFLLNLHFAFPLAFILKPAFALSRTRPPTTLSLVTFAATYHSLPPLTLHQLLSPSTYSPTSYVLTRNANAVARHALLTSSTIPFIHMTLTKMNPTNKIKIII